MGISSNQARFLALTSRQVDLENRVQQICQRRLRLSSEFERVATEYNNNIGNRKMFTFNTTNSGISQLSIAGIKSMTDTNGNNYFLTGKDGNTAGVYNGSGNYSSLVSIQGSASACTGLMINSAGVSLTQLGLTAGATYTDAAVLEAAIRNGVVTIATKADEFTQSRITTYNDAGDTTSDSLEFRDWRTLPVIADELYKGDDVDAENKYDRTVAQINQQDKKLQLEQSSIEVEYKATTSEKEAVKKILDTNATASFKYFS